MTTPASFLHVVTAPGLETVARDELNRLRLPFVRTEPGVVVVRGTLADAFRINLASRTASRVLLEIASFPAPGKRELAGIVKKLDLNPYVEPGVPIHIHATSAKSKLIHTGLVAEVMHQGLGRPTAEKDDDTAPEVYVRLMRDKCTVSIDTTGELLHKRGWRVEPGRAPMRETLAAGALLLAGWIPAMPLLDPMCGSGTLAIEAALIARQRLPGRERRFAMESFPSVDAESLARVRAVEPKSPSSPPQIFASDVNAGAVEAARRNAERAGVADAITFERVDVATRTPPAPNGLLITNPPYGERLEEADALKSLATALHGPFRGWRRALFAPPGFGERMLGRKPNRAFSLRNGGLAVELAIYERDA